jgi:hypothetical protein
MPATELAPSSKFTRALPGPGAVDAQRYQTLLQSLNRLWSRAPSPARRARMDALIRLIDAYEDRTTRHGAVP